MTSRDSWKYTTVLAAGILVMAIGVGCSSLDSASKTASPSAPPPIATDGKSIDSLVAQLKSPNDGIRARAIDQLGLIKNSTAVESLLAAGRTGNARTRAAVAQTLGRIGDKRAIDWLIEQSKAKETRPRLCAVNALSAFKDGRVVTALITALTDPEPEVTEAAIVSLAEIGDSRAQAPLARLLCLAKQPAVVATALRKLGWKPANSEQEIYWLLATVNKPSEHSAWTEIKSQLIQDLLSTEPAVKERAYTVIVESGLPEVVETLEYTLLQRGDLAMAEFFLNNKQLPALKAVARTWAEKHGYRIVDNSKLVR